MPQPAARRCTFAARASAGSVSGMSSSTAFASAGLLRLESLPVAQHLLGPGDLDVAEDVRMAVHQLRDEALGDVVDVEPSLVGRDLGVKRHLQQQVAKLVAHARLVAGVDRGEQLVGLFEQVPRKRPMGLLAIPRTAVGRAEQRLHANEIEKTLAALRRRHRAAEALGAHGEGVTPLTAPLWTAVALGSVLVMRTTASCWSSNRPKLGSTSMRPAAFCSPIQVPNCWVCAPLTS